MEEALVAATQGYIIVRNIKVLLAYVYIVRYKINSGLGRLTCDYIWRILYASWKDE